ncbi:hypothetical protein [Deinococcus sonorensis]|uniref:Uncharacterized protein n=2 Tax=Deinococcus sonorensis TaxID=309891 RepID=A0AAU7UFL0_9DEIO
MTRTSQLNDESRPLDLPTGTACSAPGPYELLSRRARALAHDARFLTLLSGPGVELNDAVRLALDAVPELELLPLPELAEELGTVLSRARTPGRAPRTQVWLA